MNVCAADVDEDRLENGALRKGGTVRIIYRYEQSRLLVLVLEIAQRQGAYG